MNHLTIRHELHPERQCGDKNASLPVRLRSGILTEQETSCGRSAEFMFDAPGELAQNLCHYHARKRVLDLVDQMHAEALRAYDAQTVRLRALGKPCVIPGCGVRREQHDNRITEDNHPWTDDEDDARAYERDHK